MDESNTKFDLVLQIIEHPDDFSAEQLDRLLSDPESREIYDLLCKTESAVKADVEVNVEEEWEVFSRKHSNRKRPLFFGLSSRAASVIILTVSSIVALAIGVTVTVSMVNNKSDNEASVINSPSAVVTELSEDNANSQTDTIGEVEVILAPVLFEDSSLQEIMSVISKRYGVESKFNNKETGQLRLYYKFDPSLSLDEIISQLNNFEQIHIIRNNSLLIID